MKKRFFSNNRKARCHRNISKEEQRALEILRNYDDIIIKQADKGSAVVILDRDRHVAEAMRQLNDSEVYILLKKDPTVDMIKIVNGRVEKLQKDGCISHSTVKYLMVNNDAKAGRFYLLPEIHKKNCPRRPVISSCNTPTEKIAPFVDNQLKPLVSQIPSFVKDTNHFLNKLKGMYVCMYVCMVRILLDRLIKNICPIIVPEAQCGFTEGRGTVDMVFTARQLQEKCIEQRLPLYQVFVDLTKAFDTVNRDALWIILGKIGCPPTFVRMFQELHRDMKARVTFNGKLSEEFAVDNGVKQGGIPAPTLFSIYFAMLLTYTFKDCDKGVYIRFRTTGSVFNLRRFNTKTKNFSSLIRELLYADDADFVSHSEEVLQEIMNLFSTACDAFGLTISIKKTKVMFTPVPGAPYVEPDIFVKETRLEVVDTFVYLGSTISKDGSLDAEINLRTQKASTAFGKLEKRVWSDRGITIKTKISVYSTCILTALLYSSECWTTIKGI